MRSIPVYLIMLFIAAGCEDPGAEVTAAEVEPPPATPAPAAPKSPSATEQPSSVASLAIDPKNSKIEFVGAKITKSHDGGFRDFAGTLKLAEPVEQSQVEVTIQTASLWADAEKLTKHLKSPDFFDVERYPTAQFSSTKIVATGDGHTITGDLTLHGVTKRISFPAKVSASASEVSAQAEFAINRQDFGITYPGMPDDLIRDKVVIKLDLKLPREG